MAPGTLLLLLPRFIPIPVLQVELAISHKSQDSPFKSSNLVSCDHTATTSTVLRQLQIVMENLGSGWNPSRSRPIS